MNPLHDHERAVSGNRPTADTGGIAGCEQPGEHAHSVSKRRIVGFEPGVGMKVAASRSAAWQAAYTMLNCRRGHFLLDLVARRRTIRGPWATGATCGTSANSESRARIATVGLPGRHGREVFVGLSRHGGTFGKGTVADGTTRNRGARKWPTGRAGSVRPGREEQGAPFPRQLSAPDRRPATTKVVRRLDQFLCWPPRSRKTVQHPHPREVVELQTRGRGPSWNPGCPARTRGSSRGPRVGRGSAIPPPAPLAGVNVVQLGQHAKRVRVFERDTVFTKIMSICVARASRACWRPGSATRGCTRGRPVVEASSEVASASSRPTPSTNQCGARPEPARRALEEGSRWLEQLLKAAEQLARV